MLGCMQFCSDVLVVGLVPRILNSEQIIVVFRVCNDCSCPRCPPIHNMKWFLASMISSDFNGLWGERLSCHCAILSLPFTFKYSQGLLRCGCLGPFCPLAQGFSPPTHPFRPSPTNRKKIWWVPKSAPKSLTNTNQSINRSINKRGVAIGKLNGILAFAAKAQAVQLKCRNISLSWR